MYRTPRSAFIILLFSILPSLGHVALGQLVINEICPSNISNLRNSNGQYDDWIEIYNASLFNHVDLEDWGLSDDSNEPYKFRFPDIELHAGERLVIFAADFDKSRIIDHWEGAVLTNNWRYYSQAAAPDTNWRNPGFNVTWPADDAPFGYSGSVPVSTTISSSNLAIAMRKTFTVNNPDDVLEGVLHVDYDDGFVAYLNGVEIARSNLGVIGQRPAWNLPATVSHSASLPNARPDSVHLSRQLLSSLLVQGQNVLAVEVHNKLSSNDLVANAFLTLGVATPVQSGNPPVPPSWFLAPTIDYYSAAFKLSRSGETVYLTDENGVIIDQRGYPSLMADNSVGCSPDGNTSTWCTFSLPTPGSSNTNSDCFSGYASSPLFSLLPGHYATPQVLEISTFQPSGEIRYTMNGNEPDSTSDVYTGQLAIDRSKVIRARVFAPGLIPGPIVTNSYFINEDLRLPIFSITTDSLNLWDYQSGIYVLGPNASTTYPYQGANFWQDWRKASSVEFYDISRSKVMDFDAEISIYGNYSRAKPQKSFEINLGDRFGTSKLTYNFMPDKPQLEETDNIVLRNSGTDWNKVHFRDAFIQRMMKSAFSGYLASEPTNLFLNGEYWGVYTIHENHDHHWMKYNYGIDKEELDYLKEDGSTITVKSGSDYFWWDMYNYAVNEDASTDAYHAHMDSVLDLENFADYFIVETYINNDDWIGDWTNNIKMWRPKAAGGKFRYLLYDTDMGFGYAGLSVYQDRLSKALDPSAFSHSSELFDHVTDNPSFRRYFINRYADLINTVYRPSQLDAVMRSIRDSMAHDMPEHWQQWGGSQSTWDGYVSDMQDFYHTRPDVVRNHIEAAFQLTDQEELTLQTNPPGAGRIRISTVIPASYPWTGVYFQGNPVTLTAIPNPGYEFTHWSSTDLGTNDTNITTQADFTTDQIITAHFAGSPRTPQVVVSEFNYNSSAAFDAGDWIELKNTSSFDVDLTDWVLSDEIDFHRFHIPPGTVVPANGYLVIAEHPEQFSSVYPSVQNLTGPLGFGLSNDGDQIRLFDHKDSLVTSFYYSDMLPWPQEADGAGYTCERLVPLSNPGLGTSWFPGCLGGSPGGVYGNTSGLPVSVTGSSTFCTGGFADLEATFLAGYSYQWYLDGAILPGETGSSVAATQPGIYRVNAAYQGCVSESQEFILTSVLTGPEPTVISNYRCEPGAVTLMAQSTDTVYWFDAVGGQLVAVGDTFITPALTTTTTYFAQTSIGCPSNAVAVTASIIGRSATPFAIDRVLCGPGPVTLSVQDTSVETRWYNAPAAGALVMTGDTLLLAYLGNDTTFYIESGSLCPSERTVLNVTVAESSTPTVENVTRCGPGTVDLQAISPDPVQWRSAPVGGSLLYAGSVFSTQVTASTVYYVQSVGTCFSSPVPVVVTVLPIPSQPTSNDTLICTASSVSLVANSAEQVYWYADTSSQTPLFTGPVFATPFVDTTTTYYIETGYVCRSFPRVPVNVEVSIPPVLNLGNDTAIVAGEILALQASSGFDFYMWSTGAQGPSISVTQPGTYFVTGITGDGCSVTDYIEVSLITGLATSGGVEIVGIHPNPASEFFTVSYFSRTPSPVKIILTDVSGRTVAVHDACAVQGLTKSEIATASLARGTYFLRIDGAGMATSLQKIVIF